MKHNHFPNQTFLNFNFQEGQPQMPLPPNWYQMNPQQQQQYAQAYWAQQAQMSQTQQPVGFQQHVPQQYQQPVQQQQYAPQQQQYANDVPAGMEKVSGGNSSNNRIIEFKNIGDSVHGVIEKKVLNLPNQRYPQEPYDLYEIRLLDGSQELVTVFANTKILKERLLPCMERGTVFVKYLGKPQGKQYKAFDVYYTAPQTQQFYNQPMNGQPMQQPVQQQQYQAPVQQMQQTPPSATEQQMQHNAAFSGNNQNFAQPAQFQNPVQQPIQQQVNPYPVQQVPQQQQQFQQPVQQVQQFQQPYQAPVVPKGGEYDDIPF